ncbi:MAG: hypothetical protein ACTHOE_14895, partial [Conexibacter sp.]
MHSADIVIAALGDLGEETVERPERWLLGESPIPEGEMSIAGAAMSARFPVAPPAAALASALIDLDREARR